MPLSMGTRRAFSDKNDPSLRRQRAYDLEVFHVTTVRQRGFEDRTQLRVSNLAGDQRLNRFALQMSRSDLQGPVEGEDGHDGPERLVQDEYRFRKSSQDGFRNLHRLHPCIQIPSPNVCLPMTPSAASFYTTS